MTENTDKIFTHASEHLDTSSSKSSTDAARKADQLIIEEVRRLYDQVEQNSEDGYNTSDTNRHLANANRLKQAEILLNLRDSKS